MVRRGARLADTHLWNAERREQLLDHRASVLDAHLRKRSRDADATDSADSGFGWPVLVLVLLEALVRRTRCTRVDRVVDASSGGHGGRSSKLKRSRWRRGRAPAAATRAALQVPPHRYHLAVRRTDTAAVRTLYPSMETSVIAFVIREPVFSISHVNFSFYRNTM